MNSPFTQQELAKICFSAAEEYARSYEGSTPQSRFFNERLHLVMSFLAPIESGTLLDIGCGPGMLLNRLADGPLDIFGLDLSPEMVAEAGARTAGRNVSLTVGQLEYLPHESESFDVILALGVLEYVLDQTVGLGEIARVAKPGAIVILSMVNKVSLYRCWERLMSNPLGTLKSRIRGGSKRAAAPRMWLHSEKSLTRMMKDCLLEPLEVVFYDVNVCVASFDSKYPKQACALNNWVKRYCPRWLFPLVHTAFLVKARRRT